MIERRFGVRAELVRGRGGVFEVKRGDDVVFSKKATGRFPRPGEVETELESLLGPP